MRPCRVRSSRTGIAENEARQRRRVGEGADVRHDSIVNPELFNMLAICFIEHDFPTTYGC